ncbi:ribonuclease H-like domain-containing protein [Tanacetum coccineum]
MTVSAKFLINVVDISNLGLIVGHPNGTQALITKIEDLKINNDITLHDVLVVPEYTVSLLSVHKLSRDSKLFVGFDESNCYIQDLKGNRTVGISNQYNCLYLFDMDNPYHLCETCNKAKQTREPISLSDHKSSKIAVWVYMLKGKDDVYDSILSFVQMISNQFETNIKVFRSDNRTEFVNNRLQSFFNAKGILHQTTCVYTPQQNVFPFKMKNSLKQTGFDSGVTKDLNQKNYFDNESPKRPYDEGRVSSNDDGSELSPVNQEFNSEVEELPVNNVRRSTRQTKLPTSSNDFVIEGKVKYGAEKVVSYDNLNHEIFCFTYGPNKSVEPTCYEEASLDNNWIDAMNVEIEALNKNHTWDITDLPANRKVIVKMSTIKYVIALSVTNNWSLFQLDVNNVFLYGDLDEEIYMTIPKGFASKDDKNKVCRLVKSLYGLKQAPRKWNEKLLKVLKENDFVQSVNDHSLFTKSKNNKFIALFVYVDDIVVTGNCVDEIEKFKKFLESKFKIKDLGSLKYFLGIEVIKLGPFLDKGILAYWSYRSFFLELKIVDS